MRRTGKNQLKFLIGGLIWVVSLLAQVSNLEGVGFCIMLLFDAKAALKPWAHYPFIVPSRAQGFTVHLTQMMASNSPTLYHRFAVGLK